MAFNTLQELEEAYFPILEQVKEDNPDMEEEEINEESYEVFENKYGVDFNDEYDRLSQH